MIMIVICAAGLICLEVCLVCYAFEAGRDAEARDIYQARVNHMKRMQELKKAEEEAEREKL